MKFSAEYINILVHRYADSVMGIMDVMDVMYR